MTIFCRLMLSGLFFFCLAGPLPAAETTAEMSAEGRARIEQLEQQNRELHQQLRAARRELAMAKNAEQEPGATQIFAGIGIIFGLCGVAMMVSARRKP